MSHNSKGTSASAPHQATYAGKHPPPLLLISLFLQSSIPTLALGVAIYIPLQIVSGITSNPKPCLDAVTEAAAAVVVGMVEVVEEVTEVAALAA